MAKTERENGGAGDSGIDRLRDEFGNYVNAWVGNLAEKAGDKLVDVTDQLTDIAENGGSLAQIGSGILHGDSPITAAITGKDKKVNENGLGTAKEDLGGGS